MAKNINSVIVDLNRKVSPGNVNQSKNIFGTLSEAGRDLLSVIKPKELSRRVIIENALYDQVNRFHCPDDLDQKLVMQVYRLDGNRNIDTFYHEVHQTTNRRFDQHRIGDKNMITIEWDQGVKFIKLSNLNNNEYNANDGLTIHTMDSITENGSWNVFGNVVDLITDNLTYVAGSGSLRFDINTSSNTGGIQNFTLKPFNLKDFLMVGKIFTWLNLPNINQLQTVTLEMFSSAGNGYSITVNSPHDTTSFQEGQNLLGFTLDPSVMNTIGTPDPSNLNQIKFTFVTNGTLLMNDVRIDNVVARKGVVYGIQYISKNIFRDINGLWKEDPTVGSDEVMLEYEAYQLYVNQAAINLGEEIFTEKSSSKLDRMKVDLLKDYAQYKKNYKAEFIDEQQFPYRFGCEFGYNGRGYNNSRWDHSHEI